MSYWSNFSDSINIGLFLASSGSSCCLLPCHGDPAAHSPEDDTDLGVDLGLGGSWAGQRIGSPLSPGWALQCWLFWLGHPVPPLAGGGVSSSYYRGGRNHLCTYPTSQQTSVSGWASSPAFSTPTLGKLGSCCVPADLASCCNDSEPNKWSGLSHAFSHGLWLSESSKVLSVCTCLTLSVHDVCKLPSYFWFIMWRCFRAYLLSSL